MHHGDEEAVPYSTHAKHHKVVAKITVEVVLKHLEAITVQLSDKNKLCVADFGTCDGVLALDVFSKILDSAKYIHDIHCTFILNEQEINDLSLLGRNMSEWEYFRRSNVSVFLNAGNMYRICLPPQSVDVVICNFAVHIMEHIPVQCFMPNIVNESDKRELIRKRANTEWTNFLTARCDELKTGGMVVTTVPSDNQIPIIALMAGVWSSMFDCGLITEAEYRGTVIPIYLRTPEEVLAPFHNGAFKRLHLVSSEKISIDHTFKCLDSTGEIDIKASALSIAENIRSWSRGYIHKSLQGTEEDKRRILDIYYERLYIKAYSYSYEDMSFQIMIIVAKKE